MSADHVDSSMKSMLLEAPDSQLDFTMRSHIEKNWASPPKAKQILEVLDHCARYALASDFVMRVLRTMYELALARENTNHAAVSAIADATWRKEMK